VLALLLGVRVWDWARRAVARRRQRIATVPHPAAIAPSTSPHP